MSSEPQIEGKNWFRATDFAALNEIKAEVIEGTCEVIQGKMPMNFIFSYFIFYV